MRETCCTAILSCTVILCCLSLGSSAQDTLRLHNVEIISPKTDLSHIGKKTEDIDSLSKDQFRFSSVADLINLNSPVYVKSYGPGAVAGTPFRGGNAAQTVIMWNGFNLQNSMLGQPDLSLLPSMLFENVMLEYGGSSSLWGSGAIGGSIHLDNRHLFNAGLSARINMGGGNTGLFNSSANIVVSRNRFISSSKFYDVDARNNFRYKSSDGNNQAIATQKNAAYRFNGFMQELKFLINSKQMINVNAWINNNRRRLPLLYQDSKTYQEDKALRLTADWTYNTRYYKTTVRGAFFNDIVNYTDSIVKIFSKNKVQVFMAENEHYYTWMPGHQFNIGVNHSTSMAFTNNYDGTRSLSRTSVLMGQRSLFFENRLKTFFSARIEYFNVGKLPVTGSAGIEYKLIKEVTVLLNAAKVYRQPTLNDLYWMPGGNIHLKPEEGYTFESAVKFEKQIGHFQLFISGAAYSRKINNWILWLPSNNGNPSPFNIQKVWSRGTETTWRVNYEKNKLKVGVTLFTSYVLSTVLSNAVEQSNTTGKQLIYTPRYTANGNLHAAFGPVQLIYFSQYVGYRFTASDNSEWLDPYYYSSLKLNYGLSLNKIKIIFFGACNNVLNTDYVVSRGWPMPLRNYEIGITLQTIKKK